MKFRCYESDYGYDDTLIMDALYRDTKGVKASCSCCGGTTARCCQDTCCQDTCCQDSCCNNLSVKECKGGCDASVKACLGGCDPGVKACLGGCDPFLYPAKLHSTSLPARVKYINCCK